MPLFSALSNVARIPWNKPLPYLRKFLKVSYFRTTYKIEMLTFSIAKFNVDVQGYTVEDDDMLCLKLKVDFMKPFLHFW